MPHDATAGRTDRGILRTGCATEFAAPFLGTRVPGPLLGTSNAAELSAQGDRFAVTLQSSCCRALRERSASGRRPLGHLDGRAHNPTDCVEPLVTVA